jgi:hypothetical protein
MALFHDSIGQDGHVPDWPYPIRYDSEQEIDADVLVIGGGMADAGQPLVLSERD